MTDPIPEPVNGRGLFRRGMKVVLRYARYQPLTFTLSLIGATAYAGAAVGTTVLLGRITDELITPAFETGVTARATLGAGLALVCIGILRALAIVARRYFAALTTFRTQAMLRRQVTDRYLGVPLDYYRTHPTGELLAHADSDVLAATEVLNALPFSLGVIALIVFAIISLVLVDPVLALVAVVLFPLLGIINRLYTARIETPVREVQERVGEVSSVAHESFDGAMVVKTLGTEEAEVAHLDAAAARLQDARVRVGGIRAVFEPIIDALPNIGIVVLLVIGAWQVSNGNLATGDIVQAMALFSLLAMPMRIVGFFLQELPRSVAATDRIDGVLAQSDAPRPAPHEERSLPDGPIGIAYDRVSFAHAGVPILTDVRLQVEPGEVLALVGSTGSGKTTLCDLLVRMTDPISGQVTLGGVDVRDLSLDELRTAVALVFQETFLFADTLRENVALGTDPSEADLRSALVVARAASFVDALPGGLETVVGERGVTLSGGQRQRIALARALVRRPRVLVLDDATSAVDPVIEAEILQGLRGELATTTLVVAHRVSTIELADRVAFLHDGRLRAVGTHADLLAIADYQAIVRAYETGEGEVDPDDAVADGAVTGEVAT